MKRTWRFSPESREYLNLCLCTFNVLGPPEKAPLPKGGYSYLLSISELNQLGEDERIKNENKYGRGFYEERRQLLQDTLNRLEGRPKCNESHVVGALLCARSSWQHEVFGTKSREKSRHFYEERDLLRKNVFCWLRKLERFLENNRRTITDDVSFQSFQSAAVPHIHKVLEALENDYIFNKPERHARRRASTKEPRPWLVYTHETFTEAGIPKSLHSDLLTAIGFLPFRPVRSPSRPA